MSYRIILKPAADFESLFEFEVPGDAAKRAIGRSHDLVEKFEDGDTLVNDFPDSSAANDQQTRIIKDNGIRSSHSCSHRQQTHEATRLGLETCGSIGCFVLSSMFAFAEARMLARENCTVVTTDSNLSAFPSLTVENWTNEG